MLFDFCNSIAELVTGIPRKEVKSEIEIHPVMVEAKVRKCPIYFRAVRLWFLTINSFFSNSLMK